MPAFSTGCWNDVVNVRVPGGVLPGQYHVHGALSDINAPDFEPCVVETNGGGQADIPQSDDADGVELPSSHEHAPELVFIKSLDSLSQGR